MLFRSFYAGDETEPERMNEFKTYKFTDADSLLDKILYYVNEEINIPYHIRDTFAIDTYTLSNITI